MFSRSARLSLSTRKPASARTRRYSLGTLSSCSQQPPSRRASALGREMKLSRESSKLKPQAPAKQNSAPDFETATTRSRLCRISISDMGLTFSAPSQSCWQS